MRQDRRCTDPPVARQLNLRLNFNATGGDKKKTQTYCVDLEKIGLEAFIL
jgi:hypothetical protein